jgi:hypothetical protein
MLNKALRVGILAVAARLVLVSGTLTAVGTTGATAVETAGASARGFSKAETCVDLALLRFLTVGLADSFVDSGLVLGVFARVRVVSDSFLLFFIVFLLF